MTEIAINGRFLLKPFTGIGQYTINLLELFGEKTNFDKCYVIVPKKIKGLKLSKRFEIVVLKERKLVNAGAKKTWWEQIQVPEKMIELGIGAAIFPYPSNPWSEDWYQRKIKTIVTVHDCIPWTDKRYRRGVLSSLYHGQTKKAVGRADQVWTVSENSKKEIVKVCRINPKKIKVRYNDVADIYKNYEAKDEKLLKKLGVEKGEYFLYVGGYDVRKNVGGLLAGFSHYQENQKGKKLVLAGGKLFKNKLYESYDHAGDNVVRTGFLSGEELATLYQNCLAFVNLSENEGFNIPILEAAYSGVPLILSDIAVHREVAGEKAIFVNNSEDLAMAMRLLSGKKGETIWRKKSKELAKWHEKRRGEGGNFLIDF